MRSLPADWRPGDGARGRAPEYIRRIMGPHDTFVRSHARGGDDHGRTLITYLSKYSAVADALATADTAG